MRFVLRPAEAALFGTLLRNAIALTASHAALILCPLGRVAPVDHVLDVSIADPLTLFRGLLRPRLVLAIKSIRDDEIPISKMDASAKKPVVPPKLGIVIVVIVAVVQVVVPSWPHQPLKGHCSSHKLALAAPTPAVCVPTHCHLEVERRRWVRLLPPRAVR